MNHIVILAGGIGSRFWPLSREDLPKQFLDILGVGQSLLQLTFNRFKKRFDKDNIWIITNEQYVPLVREQITEIPEKNILAEPSRNNTAPCIAYATLKIRDLRPGANLAVVPSDHLIIEEEIFLNTIDQAFHFAAENQAILTLGIVSNSPHTGYGYIEKSELAEKSNDSVFKVGRFTEKPDSKTALKYYKSGYLWNAGIFIFQTETILKAFKKHASDIYNILHKGAGYFNTPEEAPFLKKHYPMTPNISFDYAIMEHAENIYTIPAKFGWSDLGSWSSLLEFLPKDGNGNVILTKNALTEDTHNSIIRISGDKRVVIRGLHKYLIVEEKDVLLIYPLEEEQDIKRLLLPQ